MNELKEYEIAVRNLSFGRTQAPLFDDKSDALYRRFVRGGIRRALRRAMPIALSIEGDDTINAYINDFFDEAPPQTKVFRNLPLDFNAYIQKKTDICLPLKELIHFECIELEVLFAEEPDSDRYSFVPKDEYAIYTHPSARLCIYMHDIDRLKRSSKTYGEQRKTPCFVVAYRRQEGFAHKRISQKVAVLLSLSGEKTVGESLNEVTQDIDERRFLKSQLSSLCSTGIIHGFYSPNPKSTTL